MSGEDDGLEISAQALLARANEAMAAKSGGRGRSETGLHPEACEVFQAPVQPRVSTAAENDPRLREILESLERKTGSYEKARLPSRGLLNPEIQNGEVEVKMMSGVEERIILNPRMMRSGTATEELLRACVRGCDPLELAVPDRVFLLFMIRGLTYGVDYPFVASCPECAAQVSHTCDIDKLSIVELDESKKEPLEGVFPISGYRFVHRYERGKDEVAIKKFAEAKKRALGAAEVPIEDLVNERVQRLVLEIEGFTERSKIAAIWEKLPEGDRHHFRNESKSDKTFGIDPTVFLECPFCDQEFNVELPMTASFFSPQKILRRS